MRTHDSRTVERVLEYQFLADLTPELLRRDLCFEVLRGDFDLHGHDLVIEVEGIMRHIQLKSTIAGGKCKEVDIHTRLAAKPSGCIVWMTYDPATFRIIGWRWFGSAPGEPLPELGCRIARHSRGKAERPLIRTLGRGRFTPLSSVATLADRLFGAAPLTSLPEGDCE